MPLKAKLRLTLRRLWRPLGRARRSRGFGVHSPFAFRFITLVLRDSRSVYYSTGKIRDFAAGRRRRRNLAMLFRIVCDRKPQTLVLPPDLPEAERRVIHMADSRLQPITPAEALTLPAGSCRLFICLPELSAENLQAGRRVLSSEDSTLVLLRADSQRLATLKDGLVHIMTFTNGKYAVLVSRHGLPMQNFEINF